MYQGPAHLHNYYKKEISKFYIFDTCTSYKLSIKVASLVLCRITLVLYPDDGHLRIETCGNIQCDIVI